MAENEVELKKEITLPSDFIESLCDDIFKLKSEDALSKCRSLLQYASGIEDIIMAKDAFDGLGAAVHRTEATVRFIATIKGVETRVLMTLIPENGELEV